MTTTTATTVAMFNTLAQIHHYTQRCELLQPIGARVCVRLLAHETSLAFMRQSSCVDSTLLHLLHRSINKLPALYSRIDVSLCVGTADSRPLLTQCRVNRAFESLFYRNSIQFIGNTLENEIFSIFQRILLWKSIKCGN